MEQLCDNLIKTFNTNILKKQDKFTQAVFYSISKNKYNTLSKLIQNHYTIQKPIIDYIGRPDVLTKVYNKKYNMIIYLFGESHFDLSDCPKKKKSLLIENYLEELILKTDVFLDIFIEIPDKIKDRKSDSSLNQIHLKFENLKCQLARIHYTDVREIKNSLNDTEIGWFSYNISKMNIFDKNINRDFNIFLIENQEKINYIFDKLTTKNKQEYNDFWISQFYKNKLINKELQRSYLKEPIFEYIKTNVLDIINNEKFIKEITEIINKIKNTENIEKLIDLYYSLYSKIIPPNSINLDIYTLSRIFKKFNVENKFMQPEKPKNIIFYGGSAHTYNIYKFLISNGFEEIEKTGNFFDVYTDKWIGTKNKYEFCIDMKSIKQPLFS